MWRRWKDVFGPLLPTAPLDNLISMDVELLDDPQNNLVRSRPFPANAEDTKEVMRQISVCVLSDLAEEFTRMDFRKHCSPCILVDEPEGSANLLVVHYDKLNKLTKTHPGTLPSLERALERASACRYKSELEKRSGFFQVELINSAEELPAFVAPNGNVFKWKVIPLGLANSPATFQELMKMVRQRLKRKAPMQQLLKCGAVIGAYIDEVPLGADTVDDQMNLVEEFLRNCHECHTKVKLSRCDFMKESCEYSGLASHKRRCSMQKKSPVRIWALKSVVNGQDP